MFGLDMPEPPPRPISIVLTGTTPATSRTD